MSFTFKDAAGATQTAPSPNANGQALAVNSAPVVLASDQPALAVTGPATDTQMRATPLPVSGTIAVGGTLPAFAAAPTVNIGTAPAIVLGAGAAAIGTVGVTGSVAVTAASLPLPTGAAISAKQAALGVAGTPSADVLSVQGAASMTALKVDGSAVTQPVSNASLPLPAGASTSALQTAANTSLTTIATAVAAPTPAGTNLIGSVLVPETTFFNDTTTAIAASTTYSGTARDVGVAAGTATPSTYFNAFFFADQIGTANVQCSNDGAAWRTIATAAIAVSTPLLLSVPVMTRYHRVQLVNGATLQTAVMVNSSYSGS